VNARRRLLGSVFTVLALVPPAAHAQGGGAARHSHGSHSQGGTTRPIVLGAVGGGYSGYGLPYFASIGPSGVFMFAPPMAFMGPGAIPPAVVNGPAGVGVTRGPLAPPPPPGWLAPPPPERGANPASRKDPARSAQLMVMGDRLFRAGNFKKAEERYLQAARLDAASAGPRIRLAQVALVREQYAEAAHRFREAEIAQPGWIVTAPDIQAIFAEPSDFARHLARLESYLQAHPDDRDAWLVLGAEWYLSGRTARAADVFLRLNDPRRKSDIALAAFLDATNQQ
jgi:hypothetical protein